MSDQSEPLRDRTASLRYSDPEDKCFGVVGMAIGMVIFHAEDYIISISIDREDLDAVSLAPEFRQPAATKASPKAVWSELLKRLDIASAALIANLLCRYYVKRHTLPDPALRSALLQLLTEQAGETCQLEPEETARLFNKNYDYLDQAFRSRALAEAARSLAAILARRRELSRSEILDLLR